MARRKYTAKNVPEGITVRFYHLRGPDRVINETICDLIDDKLKAVVATGGAVVSKKDNPCKKIGRAISLGRALKILDGHL